MTTPSGKIIPPRQRKIALLGSRSVGKGNISYRHLVKSQSRDAEIARQRCGGGWSVLEGCRRSRRAE